MSGYANISAAPDPNVLLQTQGGQAVTNIAAQDIANQYAPQRNQLFISGEQQKQGANDIAMVGQAAQGLLALPDEASRAAAYPGVVANLQRDGYAKNAPASYMGEAGLRQIVAQSLPVAQQYNLGLATSPGWDAAVTALKAPLPGQQGYGAAPASASAAPASGATPPYTGPALADIHPDLTVVRTPGGASATVARSAAPQFQGLMNDLEAAGYKLDPNSTGGYNPRNIAGTNIPSQHAYGTALDVNWQANPRGANTQSDIPAPLARQLAAKYGLTWGGDWQGSTRDPMHFEVTQGAGTDHPAGAATGWTANNPMNIHQAQGGVVTPGGERLATYPSMAEGVAATAAKLAAYQANGMNTVRQMYTEWHKGSPVNEADMNGIAQALGVGVDQPFQLDAAKAAAWIRQAQPGETGTGGKRLTDADIAAGLRLPQGGAPAPAGAPQAPYREASLQPTAPPSTAAPALPAGAPAAGTTATDQETGLPVLSAPRNAILPAATPAPPAGTPPASTAPATPPGQPPPQAAGPIRTTADVPAPGQVGGIPTGQASVQYQQAQELMRRALAIEASGLGATPRGKAMVDWAKGQAQLILQTDSVTTLPDGTQLHPLSGKIDNAPTTRPNFVWDPEHNAFVDKNSAAKPEFAPSPRFGPVPGYGTVMAGGGGPPQFFPVNPQGLSTQEAAKTLGAETGKDVAAQVPKYMDMGQRADQALNVIDSGIQHLNDAAKGGIPSGYFAPWLATGAAALKSLGADLPTLGIDPKAVGDIQTAQKTLSNVSSKILQNMLGEGVITDAKIDHFIHAQPDLAMDPQALQRILGWARTQFQFEHDMSIDAMKTAATSPTGTLPLNWAPQYFTSKGGFGPIYNPITGQSALPTGEGPPREPPQAGAALPRVQSAADYGKLSSGQTYISPDGSTRRKP